jgi:uncharacterized protein DUF3108
MRARLRQKPGAIRVFFLLLIIGIGVRAGLAQEQKSIALPFARGEELLYQAELNRGLLRGFDVGELRFTAKRLTNDIGSGEPVVHLTGEAITKGFLIRLTGSKYHLRVESVANANPFMVLHTSSLYEDKRTTVKSEGVFDHVAGKAVWTEREQNQKPNATTLAFTDPIHDVLTLIYFVRTKNLKPGQSFEVAMVDAGRAYRCLVNVLAGKKMSTAAGRVNTIRVEPAIFDGNREVRPRGTLAIWLSEDSRHLPVKAQIKAPIGTIDIKLKRVSYREDIARN